MKRDLLITGIPRSGTSLITSILASNTSSIVFSEPSWLGSVRAQSSTCDEFTKNLILKIKHIRTEIRNGNPIQLKISNDGKGIPSNYYNRDKSGNINTDKAEKLVQFPNRYADHKMIIKSNAQFSSCLEPLIQSKKYKIICVIRNPISAIMSWRSLNIPVSNGNMKIAEKYSSDYLSFIQKEDKLLLKQVKIADWFFKQYTSFINHITLVKYEDLIESPTKVLSKIFETDGFEIPKLKTQNKSNYYNLDEYNDIKLAIINKASYIQKYYSEIQ
jgi:hypothetical protein